MSRVAKELKTIYLIKKYLIIQSGQKFVEEQSKTS